MHMLGYIMICYSLFKGKEETSPWGYTALALWPFSGPDPWLPWLVVFKSSALKACQYMDQIMREVNEITLFRSCLCTGRMTRSLAGHGNFSFIPSRNRENHPNRIHNTRIQDLLHLTFVIFCLSVVTSSPAFLHLLLPPPVYITFLASSRLYIWL
jgi:hypothetical protein